MKKNCYFNKTKQKISSIVQFQSINVSKKEFSIFNNLFVFFLMTRLMEYKLIKLIIREKYIRLTHLPIG